MTQVVQNRKHLEAKAILRFTEFRQLARRTVTEAWRCGKALSALKDATEHGAWIPWLNTNLDLGADRATAHAPPPRLPGDRGDQGVR